MLSFIIFVKAFPCRFLIPNIRLLLIPIVLTGIFLRIWCSFLVLPTSSIREIFRILPCAHISKTSNLFNYFLFFLPLLLTIKPRKQISYKELISLTNLFSKIVQKVVTLKIINESSLTFNWVYKFRHSLLLSASPFFLVV